MFNKINIDRLSSMNYYYRNYSRRYFLDSIYENGLHNFELWTGPQHFRIDGSGYDETRSLKKEVSVRGLNIICITPQQGNPNPYNLAAKGEYLQKESFKYFKNVIDAAAELEVSMVSLNSGWDYYDEDPSDAWNRSVSMMKKVVNYGKKKSIKIVVEALQPDESHLVNSILDLKKYLCDVGNDNLYINIDLGAMARNNETISQYFETFGNKIIHCHFVDGDPIGHKKWGEGSRNPMGDFQQFDKFNYQGYFTFEFAQTKYFLDPKEIEKESIEYLQPFLK